MKKHANDLYNRSSISEDLILVVKIDNAEKCIRVGQFLPRNTNSRFLGLDSPLGCGVLLPMQCHQTAWDCRSR